MNKNKKIVMCDNYEAGVPLIEFLIQKGMVFDCFMILNEKQGLESQISGFFDYAPMAEKYSIPVYYPETYFFKSKKDEAFFRENKFDLLIQGGWQSLFPDAILDKLSIGATMFMAVLIFFLKGGSPMNWSLIQNKKRFILSCFLMKLGVDNSDVFASLDFDINKFDYIKMLYYKTSIRTRQMLCSSLNNLLEGKQTFMAQKGQVSYFPKRAEEDGLIDW